jgi:hypothetical protein
MSAKIINAAHAEYASLMAIARHKFKMELDSRAMNYSTAKWIIRHGMSTPEERDAAKQWLRDHKMGR